MANTLTLTGLTELLYQAKDIVAAEPTALIDSVTINSGSEGISINGTVNSFNTSAPTVSTSYTPGMSLPSSNDYTVTTDTLTIGQTVNTSFPITGELAKQLENTAGRDYVINNVIAQHIRAMRNTIEAHVGSVIYKGASRATGTSGTTPFASNHNSVNALRQILVDNGTPQNDGMISLVTDTTAGTNLRNLSNLYKVNESGTSDLLRRGVLQDISGIMLKESAGISAVTAGTGASYLLNGALAVGATTVTVDTGSGTILAGDVVTIGAHKYVVKTALSGGSFTINAPGIRAAAADNLAITVNAAYTANVGFHKAAVELVIRPPALPPGGDIGEHTTIADTKTGLVFDAGLYRGDGMTVMRFLAYYQAKVWKPEFVATLLG